MKKSILIASRLILLGFILVMLSASVLHCSGKSLKDEIKHLNYITFDDYDYEDFVDSKDRIKKFTWDFDKIDNIDFNTNCYHTCIRTTESNNFELEIHNFTKKFKISVKNKTLKILDKTPVKFYWFRNKEKRKTIILNIPKTKIINNFVYKGGVGKVKIEDININYLNFESGVSDIYFNNLKLKKVDFETDVGEKTFSNCELNDFNYSGNVGSLYFDGKLTGKCFFDIGIGDAEITIQGNKDDYNIEAHANLGGIRINEEKLKHVKINPNAKNKIKINSGVGNFRLDFE